MSIRILLTELKAPQLRRVEFRDYLIIPALTQDIQFPVENNGRIFLSMMSAANVTELLARITNAADLQVLLDLDSIIDGDPRSRKAETWESRRDPPAISQLQGWWESVRENIPKVSWVVPSDEQEGSWKRLGGADLLFDDAIAYLDRRRGIWLKTQEYYRKPWPACLS
ncbi:hypothetical protein M407DRAFT_242484 [Tulasnella calospora MUT 4182]|uniref:Uncharacterized protein n=1 Tax=Tulasnella calospora MUT 4182 TaxID=1051891 RepID=A0A0C3QF00_9AGAM|nr:hypothetical protein M407DRAFT_242484 [Tulasnella calospora MUT 4182]